MTELPPEGLPPITVTGNTDPEEALLEAREINKYLLAKSFFDCREFDRCAAVFLPDTFLSGLLSPDSPTSSQSSTTTKSKGKTRAKLSSGGNDPGTDLPRLSQKSLFLALYAKMLSGEKRKDEEAEMVMGPHDGGKTVNKELPMITLFLEKWFRTRTTANGEVLGSQGWLEYL